MRAALGKRLHRPPQVGVIAFFGGRRLEGVDLTALRIHAGHHVTDGAVLAGGVHRLEDQQERERVLRVQHALLFRQRPHALGEQVHGLLLILDAARPTRVVVLEPHPLLAGTRGEPLDQLANSFGFRVPFL